MEEGGEEVEEDEELGELTEEERAEYETLNRQLDQLDKVTRSIPYRWRETQLLICNSAFRTEPFLELFPFVYR